MTRPTFDALAPHYWWLERLTFGGRLQWCRTVLVPHLADRRRVLVVGDGDGRFLEAFLRANLVAEVDAVDVSRGMTRLAQRRVGESERARFHVADVRSDPLPGAGYDLIVTNFVLDCFPADQLDAVIDRLAAACGPGGRWLVGDFALPARGWRRTAASIALAGMYAFFRATTRIPAGRLAEPGPMLTARGFVPVLAATQMSGFLRSELWGRNAGENKGFHPGRT